MAVDYTPTLGNYKELKPFRYWCQKVLPLVYDDSLSYYELLCKVVDYLNKTMEDVDTLHDDVDALHDAYIQLQNYVNNYFDNLDVQEAINTKLDEMALNGSLTNLIEPLVPDIVADWLSEHITPTTPAIDNTLTVSGAGADAKVTGDQIALVKNIINDINGDNNIVFTDFDTSVNVNGVTANLVNKKLALYGTAPGSRYFCCLNGDFDVKTTQSNFAETLPAGIYKVNATAENFLGDVYVAYTATKFSSASFVQDGDLIVTDDPIMVAVFIQNNTNYGTSESPALFNVSITPYKAKVNVSDFNLVSENTNNLIRYEKMLKSSQYGFTGFNCLNGSFTEDLPAGTYTLSFVADSNTDINYIYLKIYSSDGATSANLVYQKSIVKSGAVQHITFTSAVAIRSIYFWAMPTQGESAGYTVDISAIQLEKGTEATDIIQHNITAIDYIARNELSTLKAGDSIKTYSKFNDGYIDTSGSSVNPASAVSATDWYHIIIPCAEKDQFIFNCVGGDMQRLTYCFCNASNEILVRSNQAAMIQTYTFPAYDNLITLVAPANSSYIVVNHHARNINGYSPKVYKLSSSEIKNYIARSNSLLPYKPLESWENVVVATYENNIVINENGLLKLSTDLGATWNNGIDVSEVGNIVNYHLFNNNTLLFFTNTKAYYTSNWQTYSESTCYDLDGEAYIPMEINNFNSLWDHAERKVINGVDMYVFGNYDTSTPHLRALVWYTTDYGHTLKVAYEFDLETTYPARHIHDIIYYEPEDVFIVGTGDTNATQCSIFTFKYNTAGDSWTITKIAGSNRDYKWANMAIYRDEIYYAYDNTPGAVKKCKFEDIADTSKHITVIDNLENDTLSIAISRRGEIAVIQSTARSTGGQTIDTDMTDAEGARKMYYSADMKHFTSVILPLNFMNGFAPMCRVLPVLNDGRYYVGIDRGNRTPTINLNYFLNTAGIRQAFTDF